MSNKYLLEGGEVTPATKHDVKRTKRDIEYPKHGFTSTKGADGSAGVGLFQRLVHMMRNTIGNRKMGWQHESIVEKILEEAALTDKLREISYHLSDHLGRHVTVSELKKHYVQSLQKNHGERVKGMYESEEVLFEGLLTESKHIADHIETMKHVFRHHGYEHVDLDNPDHKLTKPEGMPVRDHILFCASHHHLQLANLHNKVHDFQSTHPNKTNIKHIENSLNVSKDHLNKAHDLLSQVNKQKEVRGPARAGKDNAVVPHIRHSV